MNEAQKRKEENSSGQTRVGEKDEEERSGVEWSGGVEEDTRERGENVLRETVGRG